MPGKSKERLEAEEQMGSPPPRRSEYTNQPKEDLAGDWDEEEEDVPDVCDMLRGLDG